MGDKVIQLLATIFNTRLKTLSIIRNCYEKCSKISDEGIASLRLCPNLERLNITYTRKFREVWYGRYSLIIFLSLWTTFIRFRVFTLVPITVRLTILNVSGSFSISFFHFLHTRVMMQISITLRNWKIFFITLSLRRRNYMLFCF